MAKMTHAERVLLGRLGAYVLHSRYDSLDLLRPARAAFESKFEPRSTRRDCLIRPGERGGRIWPARLISPASPSLAPRRAVCGLEFQATSSARV